jgi:rubrerythrin
MKTIIRLIMFTLALGLMISCAAKPVKTIENLKAGYNGESTASAKYAAFAEKAKADGLDTIAVMFLATSKSEAIHAANHRKVLEKLGEKVEGAQVGAFNVLSTAMNLADAIKGETYETDSMYPEYIATAEKEKCADALKSFGWAVDTEMKHQAFYRAALEAMNGGGEMSLPAKWFVCPVCGNTYDAGNVTIACDFCMTLKEKFIAF